MEIRSDIPMPHLKMKWPFSQMEIGEAVVINDPKQWPKALAYAHTYGQKKGRKFNGRWDKVIGTGNIWRVA